MDGDDVVLVATKDIESGEEIFVEYGENYWNNNSYRLS
jgi:SET domain-containing protein